MLIFGLLSALAAYIKFSIPGVVGGTSDAREIIALIGLIFMPHWIYALGIGILATFGGPYDYLLNTLFLHITAIPIAWLFLNKLKDNVSNIFLFGIFWFFFVLLLYITVYAPVFTLSSYFLDSIPTSELINTYKAVINGIKLEAVITAIITALTISFIILQGRYKETSTFLQLAEEGADMGLWHWEIKKNRTTYNKQWAATLGYSLSEVQNEPEFWEKRVHPDDFERVTKKLNDHLQGKTPYYHAEYRLLAKNGKYKWILARGNIIDRDRSGEPLNMSGIHLDITDKMLLEENNRNLQKQIFHAQKMESIGTLAGGIAHDFNNLLTVIKGYTDMSLISLSEADPLYKNINEIKKASDRAENLTRQLLAFSRKQIYKTEVIDINTLIKDMDEMLERLIGEDIHINTVLSENLSKIKADKSQLEQIFMNLVVNARDAVNAVDKADYTKKITIETGQDYLDKDYIAKHPGSVEGVYIYFSISDNGIGMDNELQQRIFEPFFTTKEEFKGTGLGLSTVYGIVKQNNGNIYVYSEKNRGTMFKVYWPITTEKGSLSEKEIEINLNYSGKEHILLVEDDQSVNDFTNRALKEIGYNVTAMADGEAALEQILSNGCPYDLIITDLIMPKLNGKELIEKIRENYPDVKVLFISGYTDNHIVHDGLLEKDINFVQKPFSITALRKKIRQILDDR